MKMKQKGVATAAIAVIVIVIVAVAGVGVYLVTKGKEGGEGGGGEGGGEEVGELPLYAGSQSWEIPAEIQAGLHLENMPEGIEIAGYCVEGASVQEVLNWYKGQMAGWTLENEIPATEVPEAGITMGTLFYHKGTGGAAIIAMSGTGLTGTCYILAAGLWSAFEEGGGAGSGENQGGGEGVGELPLYAGSQSWEIPTLLAEALPPAGEGVEMAAYSVEGVSVQGLVDWYKGQMTGWTLENEQVGTPSGAPPGIIMGTIVFTKNYNGAAIMAFSGLSTMDPSWPEDTCYILYTGSASALGLGS